MSTNEESKQPVMIDNQATSRMPKGNGDAVTFHDMMNHGVMDGELVQVYQTVCAGPHLACLGKFPLFSGRVLEAWISNPRGVLPSAAAFPQDDPRLSPEFFSDPWIRRIKCQIQMAGVNGYHPPRSRRFKYLTKFFVPTPKVEEIRLESCAQKCSEKRGSMQLLTVDPWEDMVNIRPNLDKHPVCEGEGLPIRGQARGIVSKSLLQRLDGVDRLDGVHRLDGVDRLDAQIQAFRGTETELRVLLSPTWELRLAPLDYPRLTGMSGDCLAGLMNSVFYQAKSSDYELRDMGATVVSTEEVPVLYSKRKDRLRFSYRDEIIPNGDMDDQTQDIQEQTLPVNTKPPRKSLGKRIRSMFAKLFP